MVLLSRPPPPLSSQVSAPLDTLLPDGRTLRLLLFPYHLEQWLTECGSQKSGNGPFDDRMFVCLILTRGNVSIGF